MPDTYKYGYNAQTEQLWKMVGHTPMICLAYRYSGRAEQRVFIKCEQHNLTGSIKDRIVLYILQKAIESGELHAGDIIAGLCSGNTGIAVAAMGKALGHPVKVILADWISPESRSMIKSYGAAIQTVANEASGFSSAIAVTEAEHGTGFFLPSAFENRFNAEVHERSTGREIGHQLLLLEKKPWAFVAGAGTGGTLMGVGTYLKRLFPYLTVHPVKPMEKAHRICGIGDEFMSAIPNLKSLDAAVQVHDGDAILMAQKLSRQLGLGVGISSGANLLAAIKLKAELPDESIVVTIFPDDNKRYPGTDLFRAEPVNDGFISPEVELLGYDTLDRIR